MFSIRRGWHNGSLGMGDIVSLVKKRRNNSTPPKPLNWKKKIRKNQFDFEDFKTQLQQIKKMGNLKDLMGMIPGWEVRSKTWTSMMTP